MSDQQIRFDDGAAYERMMGTWSRIAGDIFLDWVVPPAGLRWLDVGCGNGAFTAHLIRRCAPAEVHGVDPSEAQIAYARNRPDASGAVFQKGDAQALPFSDRRFDAAVMALVIFFVPDPAKAVAEMARVVARGGLVTAYAWDVAAGGEPRDLFTAELAAMGVNTGPLPSPEASRQDVMRDLWSGAGLIDIETRGMAVERTFPDYNAWWATSILMPSVAAAIRGMPRENLERLKGRMRAHLPANADGTVTHRVQANAVKGRLSE
jgi:ubiquinone/menaquinone biosynthesis C-methylase UbiE